jgi:hypothetical protein
MPKNSDPRREALAAIEQFERTRCHGGLSEPDRGLLKRLRSDHYRHQLAEAWRLIGKYRRDPEDVQLFIGGMLSAWHFALEAPAMLNAYNLTAEDFRQLRSCAEVLRAFFSGGRIQFSGFQTTGQVEQLLQSLSWAIEMIDRGSREISTLPPRLGLNRKLEGPSAESRRMRFTSKMCQAMRAYFRRPLYPAVAALATIALETEVSVEEVRGVSRPAPRRDARRGGADSRG